MSNNNEWWLDEKYYIGQTENEEYGVNGIYARKVRNEWEYACVWFRYKDGTLQWIMKNGKIIVK